MKNVALLIPARRGSKRIPDKNIQKICGKSLIRWAFDWGISEGLASEQIFIYTDYEADELDVPDSRVFSRYHDALDGSSVDEYLKNAFSDVLPKVFSKVLLAQPTSPFRSRGLLHSLLKSMQCDNVEVVATATAFNEEIWIHSERGWSRVFDQPRIQQQRSHKAIENGQAYLLNRARFMQVQSIDALSWSFVFTDPDLDCDINNLEDLDFARSLAQKLGC